MMMMYDDNDDDDEDHADDDDDDDGNGGRGRMIIVRMAPLEPLSHAPRRILPRACPHQWQRRSNA